MPLNPLIQRAKELLGLRQQAYQQTFAGPVAERVLADLARFCRAHKTTFHPDDRAHAVAEGRREVWLRIQQHLKLNNDDIWNLYGKGSE